MSLTLPDESTMAVALWVKGEAAVALMASGDIVLVEILAMMLPCCRTSICGTLAWLPICTAVAMPPPGPCTAAVMVPGVKLFPLTNSPATSSRGTVAKAPMETVVAVRLEVVSSLVIAWDRMVPVLSKPPVVTSVPGVVGTPVQAAG